eukprot:PhM_4_TR16756/c0_g1_i1/m.91344
MSNTDPIPNSRREVLLSVYRTICARGGHTPNRSVVSLIEHIPSVREWDFRTVLIGEEAYGPVLDLLMSAPATTINFTDCNLPSAVLERLFTSLRPHTYITNLLIKGNVVTRGVYRALIELVGTNPNVTNVEMDPAPMCPVAKIEHLCKVNLLRLQAARSRTTGAAQRTEGEGDQSNGSVAIDGDDGDTTMTRSTLMSNLFTKITLSRGKVSTYGVPRPTCVMCGNDAVGISPKDHALWLVSAFEANAKRYEQHAITIFFMFSNVLSSGVELDAKEETCASGSIACSQECAAYWVNKVALDYSVFWDASLRGSASSAEALDTALPPCYGCGRQHSLDAFGTSPTKFFDFLDVLVSEFKRVAPQLSAKHVEAIFSFVLQRCLYSKSQQKKSFVPDQGVLSLFGVSSDSLFVPTCSAYCAKKMIRRHVLALLKFPCHIVRDGALSNTSTLLSSTKTVPTDKLTGLEAPLVHCLTKLMAVDVDGEYFADAMFRCGEHTTGSVITIEALAKCISVIGAVPNKETATIHYVPEARVIKTTDALYQALADAENPFVPASYPLLGVKVRTEWLPHIYNHDRAEVRLPFNSTSVGGATAAFVLGREEDGSLRVMIWSMSTSFPGRSVILEADYVEYCVEKYGACAFYFKETPPWDVASPDVFIPFPSNIEYVMGHIPEVEVAMWLVYSSTSNTSGSTMEYLSKRHAVWARQQRSVLCTPGIKPEALTDLQTHVTEDSLRWLQQRSFSKFESWLLSVPHDARQALVKLATRCFAERVRLPFLEPKQQPLGALVATTAASLASLSFVDRRVPSRRFLLGSSVRDIFTNIPVEWEDNSNRCVAHFSQQRENSDPLFSPGSYVVLQFHKPQQVVRIQMDNSSESDLLNVTGCSWMHHFEWDVSYSDDGRTFTSVRKQHNADPNMGNVGQHIFWRVRYLSYDVNDRLIPKPVGAPARSDLIFEVWDSDPDASCRFAFWMHDKYVISDGEGCWRAPTSMTDATYLDEQVTSYDVKQNRFLTQGLLGKGIRCLVPISRDVYLGVASDFIHYIDRNSGALRCTPVPKSEDVHISFLPESCRHIDVALPKDPLAQIFFFFAGRLVFVVDLARKRVVGEVRTLHFLGLSKGIERVEYAWYVKGETAIGMKEAVAQLVISGVIHTVNLNCLLDPDVSPNVSSPFSTKKATPVHGVRAPDADDEIKPPDSLRHATAVYMTSTNTIVTVRNSSHDNVTHSWLIRGDSIMTASVQYEFPMPYRICGVSLYDRHGMNTLDITVEYSIDDAASWHPVTRMRPRQGRVTRWWPVHTSTTLWRLRTCDSNCGSRDINLSNICWYHIPLEDTRVREADVLDKIYLSLESADVSRTPEGHYVVEWALPNLCLVEALTFEYNLLSSGAAALLDAPGLVVRNSSWERVNLKGRGSNVAAGVMQYKLAEFVCVNAIRVTCATPPPRQTVVHIMSMCELDVGEEEDRTVRCGVVVDVSAITERFRESDWTVWEIRSDDGAVAHGAYDHADASGVGYIRWLWSPVHSTSWTVECIVGGITKLPVLRWIVPYDPKISAICRQTVGDAFPIKIASDAPLWYNTLFSGVRVTSTVPGDRVLTSYGEDCISSMTAADSIVKPCAIHDIEVTCPRRVKDVTPMEPLFRTPVSLADVGSDCIVEVDDHSMSTTLNGPYAASCVPARFLLPGKTIYIRFNRVPVDTCGIDITCPSVLRSGHFIIGCGSSRDNQRVIKSVVLHPGTDAATNISWATTGEAFSLYSIRCVELSYDMTSTFGFRFHVQPRPCLPSTTPTPPECDFASNTSDFDPKRPFPCAIDYSISDAGSLGVPYVSMDYKSAPKYFCRVVVSAEPAECDATHPMPSFAVESSENGLKWTTIALVTMPNVENSKAVSTGHIEWPTGGGGSRRHWRVLLCGSFRGIIHNVVWYEAIGSAAHEPTAQWASVEATHHQRNVFARRVVRYPSGSMPQRTIPSFEHLLSSLVSHGTYLQGVLRHINVSVNEEPKQILDYIGENFSIANAELTTAFDSVTGLPTLTISGSLHRAMFEGTIPAGSATSVEIKWDISTHEVANHSFTVMVLFEVYESDVEAVAPVLGIPLRQKFGDAVPQSGPSQPVLFAFSSGSRIFSDDHTYPALVPPSHRWSVVSHGVFTLSPGITYIAMDRITTIELLSFRPKDTRVLQLQQADKVTFAMVPCISLNSFEIAVGRAQCEVSRSGSVSLRALMFWRQGNDIDYEFDTTWAWNASQQAYVVAGLCNHVDPIPMPGLLHLGEDHELTSLELRSILSPGTDSFTMHNTFITARMNIHKQNIAAMACALFFEDRRNSIRNIRLSRGMMLRDDALAWLTCVTQHSDFLTWLPRGIELHAVEATCGPLDMNPDGCMHLEGFATMLRGELASHFVGTLKLRQGSVSLNAAEPGAMPLRLGAFVLESAVWQLVLSGDSGDSYVALSGQCTSLCDGVLCDAVAGGVPCQVLIGPLGTTAEVTLNLSNGFELNVHGKAIGHAETVVDFFFSLGISDALAADFERRLRGSYFLRQHSEHLQSVVFFADKVFTLSAPQRCATVYCTGTFYGQPFKVGVNLRLDVSRMIDDVESMIAKVCLGVLSRALRSKVEEKEM